MTLRATSPDRKSGASPVWPAVVPLVLLPALFVGRGGKDARVLSLAVAGVVGILAWSLWSDRARAMGRSLFLRGVAGFVFWQALAAFLSPAPLAAWRPLAGASLFAGTAFLLGRHGDARHRLTWRALVVGGGLVQAVAWGTTGTLPLAGNPQYAAFWAAMSLFIAVSPVVDRRARPVHRAVGVVGTLASLFLLWSLPVRSGWMAALAGGLLWGSRRFGRRGLVGALVAGGLALAFVPARVLKSDDATAFKRVDIWRTAVSGILQKPMAGWGPGQFESLYARHALPQESEPVRFDRVTAFAHNDGLQVLAETGWPGALLAGLALVGLWKARKAGDAGGETAALASAFVFSLFNFPLASPINAALAGGTAGLLWPAERGPGAPMVHRYVPLLAIVAGGWAVFNFILGVDAFRGTRRSVVLGSTDVRWVDDQAARADLLLHGGGPGGGDAAEVLLRALLRGAPQRADLWRALGHLESDHRTERTAAAGAAYAEALARKPGHAPWWLERALIDARRGDVAGAEKALHHALRAEPRYSGAALALGQLMRLRGDPESAARWLSDLRANAAKWPVAGEGASGYQRAVLARDDRGLALALALCYIDMGRPRDALDELDRADPENPAVSAARAIALARSGRRGRLP